MYQVIFSKPAKKDLKKLPIKVHDLLEKKIFPIISVDPNIGEILRGRFRKFFKYKFACLGISYRIVYEIYKKRIIFVLMINTRENFYKQLKRRIK